MRLSKFRIQGFRSIDDVSVDGLSDINIFFGLNDVGKSNTFEAIELWHKLLLMSASVNESMSIKEFERNFGANLFQLGGRKNIEINVDLLLDLSDLEREGIDQRAANALEQRVTELGQESLRFTSRVTVGIQGGNVSTRIQSKWEGYGNFNLHPRDTASVVAPIHIISAERRFQVEQRNYERFFGSIGHGNLKKALFYAYLSSDIQQKQRFAAIKDVLAEPPFSLGELDVALDQHSDEIDIGFIRSQGRLPLENLGSGSQQLLLVLGQVFLNDYAIIALEEPEMNLSPQRQQELMIALRKLMADPAVTLNQLFISTHSPYFEFSENFYDVTLDESGHTQIKRTTAQDWSVHFALAPLGPETGARLNSLNQVRLYDRLIQDLDLRRGDMVVFVRNDAGRWELRKAEEVAKELRPITANNGKS